MLALSVVLAAAVVVSAAPSPQPAPEPIAIPIAKREHYLAMRAEPTVNLEWLLASKESTLRKYGSSINPAAKAHLEIVSTSPVKRAGSEALSDQTSLWMGPITIGGQNFQIDFDTGSSDLWVPSKSCTTGGCVGHSKYTTSSTATAQSGTFKISYGDGSSSSGPIYKDSVSVGGVSVTQQAFSPVTTMADSFSVANGYPADGIAGMGFQSLAQTQSSPFFQTMISQGKVAAGAFSFRLASSGSELYLGGANTNHYSGSFTYASVTQKAYWRIALGGTQVSGKTVSTSSTDAIIDSGTTLAYSSYTTVQQLWAAVPGSADMSVQYGSDYQGYWLFPCSSKPTMSFSFGGKYFTISAANLNLGQVSSGSSQCVGALIGQDPNATGLGNTFLLGDAFMQNVYTQFDVSNSRVGFATPK